jgi:hypothetical protein
LKTTAVSLSSLSLTIPSELSADETTVEDVLGEENQQDETSEIELPVEHNAPDTVPEELNEDVENEIEEQVEDSDTQEPVDTELTLEDVLQGIEDPITPIQ